MSALSIRAAAWLAGALTVEERKKRATWAMRLNMVLRGFWPCSELLMLQD
jgi:hypothetical protein